MIEPRRHPNVVHRSEIDPMPMQKGKHQMILRRLGAATSSQMLGANLSEVRTRRNLVSVSLSLRHRGSDLRAQRHRYRKDR